MSDIYVSKDNLTAVYNNIKQNVKTNFYTKAETDAKYYEKAQTYSAVQINNMLANKANSTAVYTKVEVDNLLSNVNTDVYSKSEVDGMLESLENTFDSNNYYTKTEIDNLLDDIENAQY